MPRGRMTRLAGVAAIVATTSSIAAAPLRGGQSRRSRPAAGPARAYVAGGHTLEVTAMAWSPDGRTLATGSADHTVVLWDTSRWEPRATLSGPTQQLLGLSWRRDSRLLAACQDRTWVMLLDPATGGIGRSRLGDDSRTALWDAITAQRTGPVLPESLGYTRSVLWTRDGRSLVTLASHGVSLWGAPSGERRAAIRLAVNPGDEYAAALRPDGRVLATSGPARGRRIDIWDAASGHHLARLAADPGYTTALAWSPSGAKLASVTAERLTLWDMANRKARVLSPDLISVDTDDPITWSPDGKYLAACVETGKDEEAAAVWDAASGRRLARMASAPSDASKRPLAWSPRAPVLALVEGSGVALWDASIGKGRTRLETFAFRLAWSPDGRTLAVDETPTRASLWDPVTGRRRAELERPQVVYQPSAWSPDGRLLATLAQRPSQITVWEARTGSVLARLRGHHDPIRPGCVRFSPDGKSLAIGAGSRFGYAQDISETGVVASLWDVNKGVPRRALSGFAGLLDDIAWEPGGAVVAAATELVRYGGAARPYPVLGGGRVTLWDAAAGTARPAPEEAFRLAWDPTGRTVAAARLGEVVTLSDVRTGANRATLELGGQAWVLAWSPDGKMLATNGPLARDATALLWDAGSGKLIHSLLHRSGSNYLPPERISIAWSPDGRELATGLTGDGQVKLWDAVGGRLHGVLPGPVGGINALAWSRRGVLAAGCQDNTIILWDRAGRGRRSVLRAHTAAVTALDWSPDGRLLASGSEDGTVRLWGPAGRQLAALYQLDGGRDWVAATPAGYYEASPGAERLIRWRVGDRLWPASRFRRRFERQDLVRRALAGRPLTGGMK